MSQVTIEQALRMAEDHLRHSRLAEAENICSQVVRLAPREPNAVYMLGMIAGSRRDWVAAERWLAQAVGLRPTDAFAAKDHGQVLMELERVDDAVRAFECAAGLAPADWEIQFRLAMAYDRRGAAGDLDRAISAYRAVVRIDPARAEAHNNLGNLLQKRPDGASLHEAMEHFRIAAERAGYLEPVVNLGSALARAGRHEEAAECYRRAMQMCTPQDGRLGIIWRNLGSSFLALGQHVSAEQAFREALRRSPDEAEAHEGLGSALVGENRLDEALEAFTRAKRIVPSNARVLGNLGVVLARMARHPEAIGCFQRALEIDPQDAPVHSRLIGSLLYATSATAESILQEAERWNQRHAERFRPAIRAHENNRDPARRLRVGYVSPDFREHCQALFMVPLLSRHDPARVEVVAYSDVGKPDSTTERLRAYCHAWRDVSKLDDAALAEQVRADKIDILIDLTMHMINNRLQTFARKPAPVQVTWLAYPGTTGVAAIDYRLTDPHLDPPGAGDAFYSEASIRLPETFWCYDPLTAGIEVNDLPAHTNGYITFGCLNNFTKLNEQTLERWGRVLSKVPTSRLMLLAPEGSCRGWVRDTLLRQGIQEDRLLFRPMMPRQQYLEQYHSIDIGLDTLPYNGHTTSLDALWMGVPIVTLVGERVVGRAGLSQLANLKMEELAVRSDEEFVKKAVQLAGDLPRLAEYRRTLRRTMAASPLMDGKLFARNIEEAYRRMWQTWCSGAAKEP